MASTQRSNLVYPTVLQDEIVKGIAGVPVFEGSKAIIINPSLQNGRSLGQVGADIVVPYFTSIGKAAIIPVGGAIVPQAMGQSSETGVVIHLGQAVSINTLAAAASQGRDIYQVAREMLLMGLGAKLEDIIIQRLVTRVVAASMVYDGSAANVTATAITGTMQKFGDELSKPRPALFVGHSKVVWDISTLADSTGRPLYTQNVSSPVGSINGVPLAMSDKDDMLLGTSPETYYTFCVKEGGVAVWMDQNVTVEEDRDSLADDTLLILHAYCVVHAYGTMAGATKAGCAAMKTRAST